MTETTKTSETKPAAKKAPAKVLKLTSPRKMGAARKSRTTGKSAIKAEVVEIRKDNAAAHEQRMDNCTRAAEKAQSMETKLRKTKAEKVAGPDWSRCTKVNADDAQSYATMLLAGTTARAAETKTGLDAKARCRVEQEMTRVGYTMSRTLNADRVKSDRLTMWRYQAQAPAS